MSFLSEQVVINDTPQDTQMIPDVQPLGCPRVTMPTSDALTWRTRDKHQAMSWRYKLHTDSIDVLGRVAKTL